ncbi:MAG TPA: flagellar biosynthetic protein FliR, partial [Acidisphaera sp.]|nr:flagellar biosynthetic protein FliR [Acidisphaera sp.]
PTLPRANLSREEPDAGNPHVRVCEGWGRQRPHLLGGHVLPAGDGAQMIVTAVGAAFALALQLAAPFVIASIVWQSTLGFVARLVPRLHVHFVGLPGQLLGGLALLALLGSSLLLVWSDAIRDGWSRLPGL